MPDMKITAGLGTADAYEALAKAGADELFAGFVPLGWLEKYTNIVPLNRREVLMHNIQIESFSEMELLRGKIERWGVPVALTFNSTCYLPEQYPLIAEMLTRLSALGFQDWILADPALIHYLNRQGIRGRIHLSGEAGCFNPDAMEFFSEFGIHRWIFPRKITPKEISACIAAVPNAEYEAFMLNERCQYSGAYCSSLHCDELEHICHVPYRAVGSDMQPMPADENDPEAFGAGGCGLCALPGLRRAGVTHLKVVGRGAHIQLLERDIRLLRRAMELGDVSADVLRRELLKGKCAQNCYYPE